MQGTRRTGGFRGEGRGAEAKGVIPAVGQARQDGGGGDSRKGEGSRRQVLEEQAGLIGGASRRGGGRQPGVNPGSTSDLLSPRTGDSPLCLFL